MAKKVATTVYITEAQQNLLKELNMRTRVPIAEFIRQGIDFIIRENRHILPGQMELGLPPGKEQKSENLLNEEVKTSSSELNEANT